jgi:peroxiredoxin
VRDEIGKFEAKGVTPLGMNPAKVASHEAWARKFAFQFQLVSDPDRSAAAAYQALKEDGRGIHRTVYLVGMGGTILFAQRGKPAHEAILSPLGD